MGKNKKTDDNWELRQKAESLLESTHVSDEGMETQDNAGLLLELRVRQIELTMQNEELRRIRLELMNQEFLIAENNASVEVGELPLVDADEQQMVQLFQYLIGNAVKFKKQGEIPRIKIYTQKAKNTDGFYNI